MKSFHLAKEEVWLVLGLGSLFAVIVLVLWLTFRDAEHSPFFPFSPSEMDEMLWNGYDPLRYQGY